MSMDRRDFLKGMMALAGVAAGGLPELDATAAVHEAEQIVKAHEPQPTGDGILFDGILFDGAWYPVAYWSIDFRCEPIEWSQPEWDKQQFMRYTPGPVTHTMACTIPGDVGRIIHMIEVSLSISAKLTAQYHGDSFAFNGVARVTGFDATTMPTGGTAHNIYFDIESLTHNA